jgi:hypothetical protein
MSPEPSLRCFRWMLCFLHLIQRVSVSALKDSWATLLTPDYHVLISQLFRDININDDETNLLWIHYETVLGKLNKAWARL